MTGKFEFLAGKHFRFFTVFLGATPVEVEITQMTCLESNPHAHWNPYLYTIEVTHGEYKWTVKKRYNQFLKLHTAIMLSGRDTDDVRSKNTVNLRERSEQMQQLSYLPTFSLSFCFCLQIEKWREISKMARFSGNFY